MHLFNRHFHIVMEHLIFSTVADNMAFSTLYLMSDVVLTYIVKKKPHTCIRNLGTYSFQKKLKKI